MKTLKIIPAGRVMVVLRSNGQVYVTDPKDRRSWAGTLVATSPPGCHALAEAFAEAEQVLRSCSEDPTDG